MNVDFKETTWWRVSIDKDDKEQVLKLLKAGEINYPSDITDKDLHSFSGPVDGTSEQMEVHNNDGNATIEAFDDNGNELWDNEYKASFNNRTDFWEYISKLHTIIDNAARDLNSNNSIDKVISDLENEQASRQLIKN